MLWGGVGDKNLDDWKEAIVRFQEMSVGKWRYIVGVPSTFSVEASEGLTVLEWGGMEAKV